MNSIPGGLFDLALVALSLLIPFLVVSGLLILFLPPRHLAPLGTMRLGMASPMTWDDLQAIRALETKEAGRGVTALTQYYGWRRDQWSQLARGFGVIGITAVSAIIAAVVSAATIETATAEAASSTSTVVDAAVLQQLSLFAVLLFLAGGIAWWRAHLVHSEFAHDLRHIST